ncbi:MAG: ribonuclease H-like domain-containing protein [Acidobacteriota bacterium]
MRVRDRLSKIYGPPAAKKELRSRLEKLTHPPKSPSLDHLLGGTWKNRPGGRLLSVERTFPLDYTHGTLPLGEIYSVPSAWIQLLAGSGDFSNFQPQRTLFLDTETTGLAGGAGTCVFLVGLGFFHRSQFRIRQLFLPDYGCEKAFLEELSDLIQRGDRFRYLVSFNGKSYDLNLLQNRFVMQRLEPPFQSFSHLDLLHPSRLLWRSRFRDCALQTLERQLLRLDRSGDIPSALIPGIYFNYLHSGQFHSFSRVFQHNRMDLLTLVSLVVLASRLIEEPDSAFHVDALSAAHLHQLRGNFQKAAQLLEAAWGKMTIQSEEWQQVSLRLALLNKKLGRTDQALRLFQQLMTSLPEPPLTVFQEAAKILEHERRHFEAALAVVDRGLALYPSPDLRHRRFRLECRLQGRRWY